MIKKPTAPTIPKVIMMLLAVNIIGVMLTISIVNFNFSEIHSVNSYLADLGRKSDISLNQTISNQDKISDKLAHNFQTIIDTGNNRTNVLYSALENITKQIENTQSSDDKILTSISATNEQNNETLNKAGGFKTLIDDIHQSKLESDQNHALLIKLLNNINNSNVSIKILLSHLVNNNRTR